MEPVDKSRSESTPTYQARAGPVVSRGPGGEREAARRALEETREALRSGEIAKAGQNAAREFERSLAAKPERGDLGEIVVRAVAIGDQRKGVPAIPLEGVPTRLKVDGKIIAEASTNAIGLVSLPLGELTEVSYEIEVLGADCGVLACQTGRATRKLGADSHLIELPRTEALKPYLERAQPLEDAIRSARDRAAIGEEVMTKALVVQEKRLVEYLEALDSPGREAPRDAPKENTEPAQKAEPPEKNAAPATNARPAKGESSVKPATSAKSDRPASARKTRVTKPPAKRGGKKRS